LALTLMFVVCEGTTISSTTTRTRTSSIKDNSSTTTISPRYSPRITLPSNSNSTIKTQINRQPSAPLSRTTTLRQPLRPRKDKKPTNQPTFQETMARLSSAWVSQCWSRAVWASTTPTQLSAVTHLVKLTSSAAS